MKYWIITDSLAAPTCDLTDAQFERFIALCEESSREYTASHDWMPEDERPVLIIDNRTDWWEAPKEGTSEDDAAHDATPFSVSWVRIVPDSIIDIDAPHEFTRKKSGYNRRSKSLKNSAWEKETLEFIERYLCWAKEIKDNDQNGEQGTLIDSIQDLTKPNIGETSAAKVHIVAIDEGVKDEMKAAIVGAMSSFHDPLHETEAEKWDRISRDKFDGSGWAEMAKFSLKEKNIKIIGSKIKSESNRIRKLVERHRAK